LHTLFLVYIATLACAARVIPSNVSGTDVRLLGALVASAYHGCWSEE
jgi:hypothetical protein